MDRYLLIKIQNRINDYSHYESKNKKTRRVKNYIKGRINDIEVDER